MGLNEAAGYGALAATAAATGWIAANHGLRPEPFLLGAAYIAIGLGLSAVFASETRARPTRSRQPHHAGPGAHVETGPRRGSVAGPQLYAINQAGLVNNLNDGLA